MTLRLLMSLLLIAAGEVRAQETPTTASDVVAESPAPMPEPAVSPDHELLEAVLVALRETTASARAHKLAYLRHPALVDVLVYVALHDNVSDVSTRAVGVIAVLGASADPTLAALVRLSPGDAVVDEAIDRLTAAQRPSAAAALYGLAADDDVPAGVRRQSRDALREMYPEYLAAQPPLRVLGSPILPMLGGVVFGSYTLSTIGRFAKSDVGMDIGSLGGAFIGGATGFVVGRNVSTERSFLHLSGMGWGLYAGMTAAGVLDSTPSEDARFSAGVLGEAAGWGLTLATAERLGFTAGDVWVTDLNGVALTAIAAGALGFAPESADERGGRGIMLGASLAGVGLGAAATRALHFQRGDGLLTGLGVVEGLWTGAHVPLLFDSEKGLSGALIGAGTGFVLGEAVAQLSDLHAGDVAQMALVSGYGYALGAGTTLLTEGSNKTVIGAMLATGLVGMGAAGRWGTPLDYAAGDFLLVPVATALAGWHGVALGTYFHEQHRMRHEETGGLTLTAMGAVGLGTLGASQLVDVSAADIAMGSIGALWGGWFGAWGAVLADSQEDDSLLTTVIASDVGLITSALLVSPVVGVSPRTMAWASLTGASAAALAALGASFATTDSDTIIAANLVASGLGLIAGGVVASRYFAPASPASDADEHALVGLELPSLILTTLPYVNRDGVVDGALVQATLF